MKSYLKNKLLKMKVFLFSLSLSPLLRIYTCVCTVIIIIIIKMPSEQLFHNSIMYITIALILLLNISLVIYYKESFCLYSVSDSAIIHLMWLGTGSPLISNSV